MTGFVTTWRRSSRSGSHAADCVEVRGDRRALRDSKHALGPALVLRDATGLDALVRGLRAVDDRAEADA